MDEKCLNGVLNNIFQNFKVSVAFTLGLYCYCTGTGDRTVYRRFASADATVPTATPMRLPIPNPNPNPKSHPNPNPIFNPNPNPFLKEQKRHRNIGQHRVIFTGYLLRDGGGFMRGYFGYALARRSRQYCVMRRRSVVYVIKCNHNL